jgi:hypothetical protein
MEEIGQALSVPQETLSSFSELFEETSVYLHVAGEALQQQGLFVTATTENPCAMMTEERVLDNT